MKRLLICFFLLPMLLPVTSRAADIYVAPAGADHNNGTKEKPLATVAAALRKARELRRLNTLAPGEDIHIILNTGMYPLTRPLTLRPEDGGSALTFIEAAPGAQPVLSGGVAIRGWKKAIHTPAGLPAGAKGQVWVAATPETNGRTIAFRQLWVNNVKAIRARSVNGERMERILGWNKKEQTCIIPTPAFSLLQQTTGIEMFIHQWWAIAVLRVRKMEMMGDSTRLFFEQPESALQSEHPWPAPWLSKETGNSAFFLSNAPQFLDEPGEWYADEAGKKIYYWPRKGEEMTDAEAVVPALETLVQVQGTIDKPVSNIVFRGISFRHTGWLRPSEKGHIPHQAGMFMTDGYALKPAGTPANPRLDNQAWIGRPAAAVDISYADKTVFEDCRFEHMAATALDYHRAVHGNRVSGCLFKDIGGTAVLAGVFAEEGREIHTLYKPADEREVCDSMQITNNLITDAANEDWSCVGIGAGHTRNTLIAHNEIENLANTGISMGWGWNPTPGVMQNNRIIANRIHHYGRHNYDCGGIYTLSAQPGSVIAGNYVDSICRAPYAHLPSHWFYLYTDEGSSGITVRDNWTPSQKYLQNANGPGNEWRNNGPQVDPRIRDSAGLQPRYGRLLAERTAAQAKLPVTEEHNELIELVAPPGAGWDATQLKQWLFQNHMDTTVYGWRNHYVVFSKMADALSVQNKLKKQFAGAEVKVYHDLFYTFSRKTNCADTATAKEWDHVLLTANLVGNQRLQQQYLEAHATQFLKWPEVGQGFCRAGFQQLQLFRNGRQLMLVISIPKDADFEKLNPKTTENNPRMQEWNRLMQQYQEGIAGTEKNETWVFLQKIKS
ncbi:L-rhamnose mutarotase [Sediminibacterium soli]|uniref:L-rhamnose mutarotase n=1 Tax=Sediminibacterium soli TaxID=2698829 RepID=UPI00137A93E6|nr:L-rhamnose mutarotase [Sediminibacterium soli]NCI48187.1 L-rhamnose mutarotase [Sediminibacterium soli]